MKTTTLFPHIVTAVPAATPHKTTYNMGVAVLPAAAPARYALPTRVRWRIAVYVRGGTRQTPGPRLAVLLFGPRLAYATAVAELAAAQQAFTATVTDHPAPRAVRALQGVLPCYVESIALRKEEK